MTHNELLALIDRCEDFAAMNGGTSGTGTALRAVVELHKPDVRKNCNHCTWISNGGLFTYHFWPCPTIQAIEKELK